MLEGPSAGKPAVLAGLTGARFVHLATHGYYDHIGAPSAGRADRARNSMSTLPPAPTVPIAGSDVAARNPMVLSGLVLAGANALSGPDRARGLLTAEEVVSLDLGGTELAVLSACETGLGRDLAGEGVFGLQRAFLLAGTRTVVASLWRVDDDATRALMSRFYANIWERRLPVLEALRQAQLGLLRDPDFAGDPRLWAAWTLSGDPGGLPRTAASTGTGARP